MSTIHHVVGKDKPSQQIKVAFIIPFIVHIHKYQPFGAHFFSSAAYSTRSACIFREEVSSKTELSVCADALPLGLIRFADMGPSFSKYTLSPRDSRPLKYNLCHGETEHE